MALYLCTKMTINPFNIFVGHTSFFSLLTCCVILHTFYDFCEFSFFDFPPEKVSNSMDPDPARRFVGPDLGPKCLQNVSAEDTSN